MSTTKRGSHAVHQVPICLCRCRRCEPGQLSPWPAVSTSAARLSANSVRLRPWQHAALDRFVSNCEPDFLAVATPGAGKTTFALVAARMVLGEQPAPVVVVTP